MHSPDFSAPQRQDQLGIALYFLQNLRKAVNAFVGYILVSALNPKLFAILGVILVVILVAVAVFAWFQYRMFTFYVQGQELIIHHGVFIRDKVTIPFDRIQTVHLHQNIIQRLLNLTGLKIDTAGSKEEELEIKALKRNHALQLQEILSRKAEAKPVTEDVPAKPAAAFQSQRQVLVSLSLPQLLMLSITENHIRNGLLAVLVVFGYISQYQDFFNEHLEPFIAKILPQMEVNVWVTVLSMIVIFLVVAVLISTIRTFLRYFDLEAAIEGSNMQVKSGLTSKKEYIIPLNKIQFLEWSTNFIRKPLGFETVKIFQAQSHEQSKKQGVEIPACYAPQTALVMEKVFHAKEEATTGSAVYKADASYAVVLSFIFCLPGVLAAVIAFAYYEHTGIWLLLALYLGGVIFFSMKYVHSIRLSIDRDLIVFKRGWLFPIRTTIPSYKIQSLQWRQNILQKRANVAHVTLYTAAGKRVIRYMPAGMIKELHNFLLYKVESHKGSWM